MPIAFEHFGLAAAYDVLAAVFLYGRTGQFLVFLVTDRIDNIDFNDDVGGHGEINQEAMRLGKNNRNRIPSINQILTNEQLETSLHFARCDNVSPFASTVAILCG